MATKPENWPVDAPGSVFFDNEEERLLWRRLPVPLVDLPRVST
jgi:hypothetical protein